MGTSVAVIGCGMMGLMAVAGLSRSAAREVIAIDVMDSRLEWARKMGATKTLNPKKTTWGPRRRILREAGAWMWS